MPILTITLKLVLDMIFKNHCISTWFKISREKGIEVKYNIHIFV